MNEARVVHTLPLAAPAPVGESSIAAADLFVAPVVAVDATGALRVRIGSEERDALRGALLPELVVGDQVGVLHAPGVAPDAPVSVFCIVRPHPARPLAERAIELRSDQRITLASGVARLSLSGEGVARLVALTVQHSARDLVDIDGAEVRIN